MLRATCREQKRSVRVETGDGARFNSHPRRRINRERGGIARGRESFRQIADVEGDLIFGQTQRGERIAVRGGECARREECVRVRQPLEEQAVRVSRTIRVCSRRKARDAPRQRSTINFVRQRKIATRRIFPRTRRFVIRVAAQSRETIEPEFDRRRIQIRESRFAYPIARR